MQIQSKKTLLSPSDSMIFHIIKNRLTVCMPLDLVNVNSPYGYRSDPFAKCRKFHDGVDLQGGHDVVYSMLPGIVVKTVRRVEWCRRCSECKRRETRKDRGRLAKM